MVNHDKKTITEASGSLLEDEEKVIIEELLQTDAMTYDFDFSKEWKAQNPNGKEKNIQGYPCRLMSLDLRG